MRERFIQQINDRTEYFEDIFPVEEGKLRQAAYVWDWLLKLFVTYLQTLANRIQLMTFIVADGGYVNRAKPHLKIHNKPTIMGMIEIFKHWRLVFSSSYTLCEF